MASRTFVYLFLLMIIVLSLQLSVSKIIIEIKFLEYSDNCREDARTSKCDPKFKFCLDRPRQKATMSSCYYGSIGESKHFQDTNFIDFRYLSNIKGIPNPWTIATTELKDSSLLLVFQVRDDDFFGDDDHLQTWGIMITEFVYPSKNVAPWTNNSSISNSHIIKFQIRIYCEAGHYNPNCINYCRASDNPSGHYTCDPATGTKICIQGWTGSNCNEDINECLFNYCERGTCENQPADYTCHCPLYYSGKNCTIMDESPCDRNPCINNATCTNMPDFAYNCTCIGDWEGENCSAKLNPCKTEPCQNGAKCIPSADYDSYSCNCVYPYIGIHCDIINPDLTSTGSSSSSLSSSVAIVSTIIATTTTSKLIAPLLENVPGIAAKRTNTGEDLSSTESTAIQHWHGVLIAVIILAFIGTIIIFLILRQRHRKQKLPTDGSVIVYTNNNKLAFENNLYNDVNRDPLEGNERQREHPPLPSTPLESDQFMSIKQVFTPNNLGVLGAEGGAYTELEIDMDADGYVKPKSCKNIVHTKKIENPLRSELAECNHYTDFNRLKSNPEKHDSVEDSHFYHDLDEIALAVKSLSNAAKEKELASLTIAASKVGGDCEQGKDVTSPSTGEEAAYNDIPSNIPVVENNYDNVHKAFNDEVSDDSFVAVTKAPDNLYSEPAKPRKSNQSEPVKYPSAFGSGLDDNVKIDMPQSSDPFASEMLSDENETHDYGLPQVSPFQDGDYCTPRGLQADSAAPESQYDIPPNNHSSKILAGNYTGASRSSES